MYEVPSAAPSYTSLLPHFVPPRTCLPHTVVVIVLDWTRPWTFMEELELWLTWIEEWTQGDSSRELDIVREESRERRAYASFPSPRLATSLTRSAQYKRTSNTTRSHLLTHYPPIHRSLAHSSPLARARSRTIRQECQSWSSVRRRT